ncbi:MAG TPA: hypothetical protein VJT32_15520 [bacterium]|nr:hypothetical protein [bacterium]
MIAIAIPLLLLSGATAPFPATGPVAAPHASAGSPPPLPVPTRDVLTQANDNARTGAYLAERMLTPTAVRSPRFGRLYARFVDGDVQAQPLYVRGVRTRAAGVKNLVLVATAMNMVYAFDADDRRTNPAAGVVWRISLGPSRQLRRPTCAPGQVRNCDSRDGGEVCAQTYNGFVGVTGTPVIDGKTGIMYVVARISTHKDAPHDGTNYLYAIDVADGRYRLPPRKIDAIDPRRGDVLDAHCQRNRPGLLLLGGIVYVGYGALQCDGFCPITRKPYHGWILGYRTSDLAQVAVFNMSPGGAGASVWQSGSGLVGLPNGTIYAETGNDYITCGDPRFTESFKAKYFDKCSPTEVRLGDSFVKLRVTGSPPGLALAGFFKPSNAVQLRDADVDLGAGGPMALPGGRLIGGGKQGRLYVLDAENMRLTQDGRRSSPASSEGFQAFFNTWHLDSRNPRCAYNVTAGHCYVDPSAYGTAETFGANIHGAPVYWQGPNPRYGLIYKMAEKDYLKAFAYDLVTHHVSERAGLVAAVRPLDGMPGGFSSLSANAHTGGILWTSFPDGDAEWTNRPDVLAAFDALTLRMLWSDPGLPTESGGSADRSQGGGDRVLFSKFTPPTIADGKVFLATFSNQLVVYGLREP